jgi:hypothetical protein
MENRNIVMEIVYSFLAVVFNMRCSFTGVLMSFTVSVYTFNPHFANM